MNREQRRKLAKSSNRNKVAALFAELAAQGDKPDETPMGLKNGDKVKLNYEAITSDPDWSRMTDERKAFVEAHKDQILTVEFDKNRSKYPVVVCLAEDTREVKWFWTDQQLTKANENTEQQNS